MIEIPGYAGFERVGAGASGTVYRARQLAFEDRIVALKVIPDTDADERTAQRFRRECLAAGKLSWHPNVVSVYDAGITDDGLAYLVMEYLEDGSLADRLRREGPLPWPRALETTIRVAGALGAAHAVGLIHRDLKPENILVGPFGEPKLGDFGIAFIEGRSRSRTGTVSGTIAHSAPEALAGKASESADIYSLGSTLYTILAGAPAFVDWSDHSITPLIARIAQSPVPDLRERGIPDLLASAVERAMAKEPNERWASATTFAKSLQDVQRQAGREVTPLLVQRATSNLASPVASSAVDSEDEAHANSLKEHEEIADEATVILDRQPLDEAPGTASDDPREDGESMDPTTTTAAGSDPSDGRLRSVSTWVLVGALLGMIGVIAVSLVRLRSSDDDGSLRLDLRAGECFNGSPEAGELVHVVDCTESHDAIVASTITLGGAGDPYPGDDLLDQRSREDCEDAVAYNHITSVLTNTFPSEDGWATGNRRAVCILSNRSGEQLRGE